jgi:hypothetical protein
VENSLCFDDCGLLNVAVLFVFAFPKERTTPTPTALLEFQSDVNCIPARAITNGKSTRAMNGRITAPRFLFPCVVLTPRRETRMKWSLSKILPCRKPCGNPSKIIGSSESNGNFEQSSIFGNPAPLPFWISRWDDRRDCESEPFFRWMSSSRPKKPWPSTTTEQQTLPLDSNRRKTECKQTSLKVLLDYAERRVPWIVLISALKTAHIYPDRRESGTQSNKQQNTDNNETISCSPTSSRNP